MRGAEVDVHKERDILEGVYEQQKLHKEQEEEGLCGMGPERAADRGAS